MSCLGIRKVKIACPTWIWELQDCSLFRYRWGRKDGWVGGCSEHLVVEQPETFSDLVLWAQRSVLFDPETHQRPEGVGDSMRTQDRTILIYDRTQLPDNQNHQNMQTSPSPQTQDRSWCSSLLDNNYDIPQQVDHLALLYPTDFV